MLEAISLTNNCCDHRAGAITADPSACMHWTADQFSRLVTTKHGVIISARGMETPFELKSPSSYHRLPEIQDIIRLWRSGSVCFEKLEASEWASLKQARDGGSAAPKVLGRRPMRGVLTVGRKCKGPMKSAAYIEDSDAE